jgi:hypothetical protein
MYLDGGVVALSLIAVFLLTTGKRLVNLVFAGIHRARMGLAFLVMAIAFNLSESSFFRLDPLWFTFLLMTISLPWLVARRSEWPVMETHRPEPIAVAA